MAVALGMRNYIFATHTTLSGLMVAITTRDALIVYAFQYVIWELMYVEIIEQLFSSLESSCPITKSHRLRCHTVVVPEACLQDHMNFRCISLGVAELHKGLPHIPITRGRLKKRV